MVEWRNVVLVMRTAYCRLPTFPQSDFLTRGEI